MLEHIGLKVYFILVYAQVNGMLHVGLIALIHPNEPVGDIFRRQVEWVKVVVWRVYFYCVSVEIIDFANANQFQTGFIARIHVTLVIFDINNFKDTVKVVLV